MINIETATYIKDIITSVATIVGIVIALIGLSTWKRQLKGQTEYSLAKNLLISLFKYRDSINNLRNPLMTIGEMSSNKEEEETNSFQSQYFQGVAQAYQKRWDKIKEERSLLYANLLEAEALWGDDLKKLFQNIFNLEHNLFLNVRDYLDLKNPEVDIGTKNAIRENYKEISHIIYGKPDDMKDDFKTSITNEVDAIEKYLKKKLVH